MNDMKKTTLTLEPDAQNLDSPLFGTMPTMGTVDMPVASKTYSVGSIDENMLSADEKAMVEDFANQINIADSRQVLSYGAAAQRNISNFSVSILNKVKTRDLGEVGNSLKELTKALEMTTEPEKKGLAGIFQKAKRGIDAIKMDYAKAERTIMR